MTNALLIFSLAWQAAIPGARVMNPGEAKGQLVYLSEKDVLEGSPKFKSLSPLSIPVFSELPMELAVVAGAITLKQQTLLSHVQIKSRARMTPNLDISELPGGLANELMRVFKDGDWVHLELTSDGEVTLQNSTEADALAFYNQRKAPPVKLVANLEETRIFTNEDLTPADFDKVGSKAANYAELARILNSSEKTVVRPSFAVPFYYYHQFVTTNEAIRLAIENVVRDPLMKKLANITYRENKLKTLRETIENPANIIDPRLVDELLGIFDRVPSKDGSKRKMKLRSSTNSEDLPNFNGAGLYESAAYKPVKNGVELSRREKEEALKSTLRTVWSSVWTLRAFEERSLFGIPHDQVKMGLQINPSYTGEVADGVVVTKNIANRADLLGAGVYIESQRGDKFSVANPEGGTHPEQVLVLHDANAPLDKSTYSVWVLQRSNVADDGVTVLSQDNPNPVVSNENLKELAYQSLKATLHFKNLYGPKDPDFSLDLEFKVDRYDTGVDQVYLKQARPYID